jgi:type VI secretion system protein ImpK
MNPKFASAVDPIFLQVLELLERIERNERLEPDAEQQHLQHLFREAEAKLGDRAGWDLARYALAVWIDEVLIEAPWAGRDWWVNNLLEFGFFKTRERATRFYLKAEEASQLKTPDAFEVFYLCVVLGFYGLYVLPESTFLADNLRLPATREQWAHQAQRRIQLGQGRPPLQIEIERGEGAPPLEGHYAVLSTVLVGVVLLAFTVVAAFYLFFSRPATGDAQAMQDRPARLAEVPQNRRSAYQAADRHVAAAVEGEGSSPVSSS